MGKTFDAKTQERMIQIVYAVGGSLLFAAGVNLLITPLGLYNGGFMGFAQLLRTFVVSVLHVPVPAGVDLSGIIYFILNIPLFYMGLKILGKEFAVKTLVTVGIHRRYCGRNGNRSGAAGQELRRRPGYYRTLLFQEISECQRGKDQHFNECVRLPDLSFHVQY